MTNDSERWDLGLGFNPWGIIGEGVPSQVNRGIFSGWGGGI